MAEPNASAGSAARKIKWLGLGVLIAIGLYATLWAFLASRLDRTVAAAIARAEESGTMVQCEGREVRGFPFRLGLHCERTGIATPDGVQAVAGPLRSAAQVYDPGLVISELDGPITIEASGGRGQVDWADARASTNFGIERLNLGTVRIENATFDGSVQRTPLDATMERLVASIRPNGPDLDAALTVDGLDAGTVRGRDVPSMNLRMDATVSGAAGAVAFRSVPVESLRGRTLTLRALNLVLEGGGRIAADGELAVDGDGLPTGAIELGFSDLPATVEAIAAVLPEYGGPLRTVAGVLDGGGGSAGGLLSGLLGNGAPTAEEAEGATEEDEELTRATIRIDRGEARLGLIPLGRVPPLP